MNDKKQIISMRLSNSERAATKATAERLYIRESELYRFAINHLLNKLDRLLDKNCTGCELLMIFLEMREDFNNNLKMNKEQLHRIINCCTHSPEKLVAMQDIELLLLPDSQLRQRLQRVFPINTASLDTSEWLHRYIINKYNEVLKLEANV